VLAAPVLLLALVLEQVLRLLKCLFRKDFEKRPFKETQKFQVEEGTKKKS
jgi:hypothetical protein